jgi:hypothetical protein
VQAWYGTRRNNSCLLLLTHTCRCNPVVCFLHILASASSLPRHLLSLAPDAFVLVRATHTCLHQCASCPLVACCVQSLLELATS